MDFQNTLDIGPLLPHMFDKINFIIYCLVRLVYKKKKVADAINLRKVINKDFLTNQSNQLEEYLIDLEDAVATEKIRRFWEGCK